MQCRHTGPKRLEHRQLRRIGDHLRQPRSRSTLNSTFLEVASRISRTPPEHVCGVGLSEQGADGAKSKVHFSLYAC